MGNPINGQIKNIVEQENIRVYEGFCLKKYEIYNGSNKEFG